MIEKEIRSTILVDDVVSRAWFLNYIWLNYLLILCWWPELHQTLNRIIPILVNSTNKPRYLLSQPRSNIDTKKFTIKEKQVKDATSYSSRCIEDYPSNIYCCFAGTTEYD